MIALLTFCSLGTVAAADFISSAFGPSIHRRGSSTARAPPMKSWNETFLHGQTPTTVLLSPFSTLSWPTQPCTSRGINR